MIEMKPQEGETLFYSVHRFPIIPLSAETPGEDPLFGSSPLWEGWETGCRPSPRFSQYSIIFSENQYSGSASAIGAAAGMTGPGMAGGAGKAEPPFDITPATKYVKAVIPAKAGIHN